MERCRQSSWRLEVFRSLGVWPVSIWGSLVGADQAVAVGSLVLVGAEVFLLVRVWSRIYLGRYAILRIAVGWLRIAAWDKIGFGSR